MTPHPDLSSSQREMREGVAQWYESRGFSPTGARVSTEALFEPSCPIASALAALERERDEARAERDAAKEEHVKAEEHICNLNLLAYLDPEQTWKDAAIKERVRRVALERENATLRAERDEAVAQARRDAFEEGRRQGLEEAVTRFDKLASAARERRDDRVASAAADAAEHARALIADGAAQ